MQNPEKLTVKFTLKNDNYFVMIEEYPFIYSQGITLNDAFNSLVEFLKQEGVYSDGLPIYIQDRCCFNFTHLGNGNTSIMEVEKIKNRLNYAYVINSGIQQANEEVIEIEKEEEKIKDVLKDIAASFGYNIELNKINND